MRALLTLTLLLARPAFACRCDSSAVERLAAAPETAQTAFLGKAEVVRGETVFRVASAWTKYAGAAVLSSSSKCDLRPVPGKRLILLSTRPADSFDTRPPTICDSILLEPAKAGLAVNRLASRWEGAARAEPNPSWGYCQRDKDCVLSPGVCGGQDALHSRFKVQHGEWRARVAPTVNCAGGLDRSGLKARCEENFCAAYSPAP